MPNAREQAEAVARWCGWVWDAYRCEVCGWPFDDQRGCVPFHCSERPVPAIRAIDRMLPNFASSLDAMREVEDEIERRGLMGKYVMELHAIWGADDSQPYFERFLIRATAAQRLEAAARVIEEVSR